MGGSMLSCNLYLYPCLCLTNNNNNKQPSAFKQTHRNKHKPSTTSSSFSKYDTV